jgi:hypothetical protein
MENYQANFLLWKAFDEITLQNYAKKDFSAEQA